MDSAGLIVAEDELFRLYSDWLEESTRLLVLKFARCKADSAVPILPGLGKAFSLFSDLLLILLGRENSFDLARSDLDNGFSSIDTGIGGGRGKGDGGGCWLSRGDVC